MAINRDMLLKRRYSPQDDIIFDNFIAKPTRDDHILQQNVIGLELYQNPTAKLFTKNICMSYVAKDGFDLPSRSIISQWKSAEALEVLCLYIKYPCKIIVNIREPSLKKLYVFNDMAERGTYTDVLITGNISLDVLRVDDGISIGARTEIDNKILKLKELRTYTSEIDIISPRLDILVMDRINIKHNTVKKLSLEILYEEDNDVITSFKNVSILHVGTIIGNVLLTRFIRLKYVSLPHELCSFYSNIYKIITEEEFYSMPIPDDAIDRYS